MGAAGFGQCHRVGLQFGCTLRRTFHGGQEARRLEPVSGAEHLLGPHQTLVDRRFRQVQPACDLLGAVVLIDQSQACALALGQPGDPFQFGARWRHRHLRL